MAQIFEKHTNRLYRLDGPMNKWFEWLEKLLRTFFSYFHPSWTVAPIVAHSMLLPATLIVLRIVWANISNVLDGHFHLLANVVIRCNIDCGHVFAAQWFHRISRMFARFAWHLWLLHNRHEPARLKPRRMINWPCYYAPGWNYRDFISFIFH